MGTTGRVPPTNSCLLLLLVWLSVNTVSTLRDDWYGFVSFEDASEWQKSYFYTCSYKIDLFREPREYTERNRLQGRRELHSPISFRSKYTRKAPANTTLHIYNNPGIRKAFSVSYGFQRNKECLHGQDADCVVFPEIGRVRAVVVQADRFAENDKSQGKNLNYLKDNFLIENPERFVTILNGGSHLEKKFYEAVFLGGYTNDPKRTSHQIDGKKYPLEIYMYFIDETVPSVSLATILVVLVEESDRDNVHIKPIVNTVHNLYDAERRFLERSQALVRRERTFHHLQASTYYDVYAKLKTTKEAQRDSVIQESLADSLHHESIFTRYVEPFEKMQALEAELFFLFEDLKQVQALISQNVRYILEFYLRGGNTLFPSDFTEYQMMGLIAIVRGYINARNETVLQMFPTCRYLIEQDVRDGHFFDDVMLAQFKNKSVVPTGAHLVEFMDLCNSVCEHFDKNFTDIYNSNINDTVMHHVPVKDKYQLIREFLLERKHRGQLNEDIFMHFHGNDPNSYARYHKYNVSGYEVPNYANPQHRYIMADRFYELLMRSEKLENYKKVLIEVEGGIQAIVDKMEYSSVEAMTEVVRFLKYGSKQNDLKYHRSKVHTDFVNRRMAVQQKKRTLVELGGMEVTEDEIEEYEMLDPIKAQVNEAFQISWLIPKDGGYYYYAGSSPIPPCFRAQNVIVFKKPISMSKRQIEVLTRVPTSFDRTEDIHVTAPYVHDTKFEIALVGTDTEKSRMEEVEVPVYNQRRNHLFLGHDGVHQNAVDEWEKIKLSKKNDATTTTALVTTTLLTMSLMISGYWNL